MFNYKLLIFKYENDSTNSEYRLALIDPRNNKGYPANFVCILPKKICDKGKPLSIFAQKFGEKSVDYAIQLLEETIKQEQDTQAEVELKKRLRILRLDNKLCVLT